MAINRLKFSGDGVEFVALAIGRISDPPHNTHTGIVYRDPNNELSFMHLGWHHYLINTKYNERVASRYASVRPSIEPERASNVAGLCRLVKRRWPDIPYSLRLDQDARFSTTTGDVVLSAYGKGLNCSNFVVIIFLSAGIALIDFSTWRARPEDADWQQYLVDVLEQTGAPKDHVEAVRAEVGCARIRPEEVAGACLEDDLPATFEQCETNGRRILQVLDAHYAQRAGGSGRA